MDRTEEFDRLLARMRRGDPADMEDAFAAVAGRAPEFLDDLLTAVGTETDPGLRVWLLELLGEARSPAALPLFAEILSQGDRHERSCAIHGLIELDTKEARTVLFKAGRDGPPELRRHIAFARREHERRHQ